MAKGRAKTADKTALKTADDDDDFTPSPRDPLHAHPDLCKSNLERLVTDIPLEIRASSISSGSGLFAGADIEAGRDIYNVYPIMKVLEANNDSFCHYCFEDSQPMLGGAPKPKQPTKACTGCNVARFCHKECQKSAWILQHSDECKILKKVPQMTAHNLMAHRLLFWQGKGYITKPVAKSLMCLESHFNDITKDPERSTEVLDVAMAVREATGNKVNLATAWKLVPLVRVNSVRLRPTSKKESVGYALDISTATINHSCDPNAHVFFEGQRLYVRSLKKIAAGEEITICYLDPTLDVAARKALLKREYFFDCSCDRCTSELKEQRSLLGDDTKLPALHQAQRDIISLISSAVRASKYPGAYPDYDNLATVETKLRTIMAGAVPADKPWPEHMEPLPSARLSLAMLYLQQGKPVPALRNALKGRLFSVRRDIGPEWVNEMVDLVTVCIVAGSLPRDAAALEDKTVPSLEDIRTVTYGFLLAACHGVLKAFGGDSEYSKGIQEMMGVMVAKRPGVTPGTKEFAAEFEPAQARVLTWAGVPVKSES